MCSRQGHCSLKPEHFHATCGNTKGFAPGSPGCAQDQEPESRCMCPEGETKQAPERWKDASATQPQAHKTQTTES